MGRPDFKSGWGRWTALGGFDSHPPPPMAREGLAVMEAAAVLKFRCGSTARTDRGAREVILISFAGRPNP